MNCNSRIKALRTPVLQAIAKHKELKMVLLTLQLFFAAFAGRCLL